MGVGYVLINVSKREKITYHHLPVELKREIAGNPVSSAITTWYLIHHCGDDIGFIPDQYYDNDRPYKDISWNEIETFNDLTDDIINELIQNNILADEGVEILFEDEPDIYLRRLKNIWL